MTSQNYCKKCGFELALTIKFCSNCGEQTPSHSGTLKSSGLSNRWVMFLCLVLLSNSTFVLLKILLNSNCQNVTIEFSKVYNPGQAVSCADSLDTLALTFFDLPTYSSSGVLAILFLISSFSILGIWKYFKK